MVYFTDQKRASRRNVLPELRYTLKNMYFAVTAYRSYTSLVFLGLKE